jgi:signal transduction histidine kinase
LQELEEIVQKNIQIDMSDLESITNARVSSIGLYRVLVNLIKNAANAVADDTGQIIVRTYDNDGPTLSVKDNGSGMTSEVLAEIFRWDFSLSKGTGIGLGMVKQICDRVGAVIEVKTEIGIGSEFIVKFKPSQVKEVGYEVQDISC